MKTTRVPLHGTYMPLPYSMGDVACRRKLLRQQRLVQRKGACTAQPIVHCVVKRVSTGLERCSGRAAHVLNVVVVEHPARRCLIEKGVESSTSCRWRGSSESNSSRRC